MCNYSLCKDKTSGIITYNDYDIDGYTFKPRMDKSDSYITVSSVTLFDKHMIDVLLNRKFERKFERLSSLIMKFLFQNDDSSDEGDFIILLDEIARLEALVENKYKRFLEVEEYKDYIHKLAFLDNQLRQKLVIASYRNSLNLYDEVTEEVKQGRGR